MQTEKSHIFVQIISMLSKKPLSIKTYPLLDCGSDKTLSLIFQLISFQLNLGEEGFLITKESKSTYFVKINTEY